jgi:hypothetical protein
MKAFTLLLAMLFAASPILAQQRGHNGRENQNRGRSGHENHGQRGGHNERRPNHSGRERHGRIHDRDTRFEHGRRDFRWGGVWFTCSLYPSWFWVNEVYVVDINGEFYVISYNDPRLMQLVVVVD